MRLILFLIETIPFFIGVAVGVIGTLKAQQYIKNREQNILRNSVIKSRVELLSESTSDELLEELSKRDDFVNQKMKGN